MPHDPELVAETRAWLSKAKSDLDAAAFELTAEPPFTADMVFHAQQAVEKAFKGFFDLAQHAVSQDAQSRGARGAMPASGRLAARDRRQGGAAHQVRMEVPLPRRARSAAARGGGRGARPRPRGLRSNPQSPARPDPALTLFLPGTVIPSLHIVETLQATSSRQRPCCKPGVASRFAPYPACNVSTGLAPSGTPRPSGGHSGPPLRLLAANTKDRSYQACPPLSPRRQSGQGVRLHPSESRSNPGGKVARSTRLMSLDDTIGCQWIGYRRGDRPVAPTMLGTQQTRQAG